MTCEYQCGGSGTSPITQKMTLRGNVIIQNTAGNLSQLLALFDDAGTPSADGTGQVSKMELTLISNTVIGTAVAAGKTQMLVNMCNDTVDTAVTMHDNIIYQVKELAVPASASLSNWSLSGQSNWVSTGTPTTGLTGSITGSSPGFVNPAAKDYHLTSASPCLGKAAAVSGLPTKEYYLDETVKLQYRPRATADDLGAFEHGNTAAPVGPYGTTPPPPDGGVPEPDASVPKPDASVPSTDGPAPSTDGPAPDDAAAADGPTTGEDTGIAGDAPSSPSADGGTRRLTGDSGCSCEVAGTSTPGPLPWLLLLLLWALRRRDGVE